MKDLRIEVTDEATALYVAVDPDGVWARTTRPDDFITVDWDGQGRIIGVEAIGATARVAIDAMLEALVQAPANDPGAVRAALESLVGRRERRVLANGASAAASREPATAS